MKSILFVLIILTSIAPAKSYPEEKSINLFGAKPIQLNIGSEGITQRKEPGFVCDLAASLGGGHYSEWGQTEEDARSIVTKKCSDKSGMLLCKKEKATCKQD